MGTVVLVAPAWGVPLLLGDGISGLPESQQPQAREALASAVDCLAPFDHVVVRRLRVVQVVATPECPGTTPGLGISYRATVRQYSFFGIPVHDMTVCAGVGIRC